jgi:1,4-dihydroxy-2-naphthoate octaprenyltransferase
MKQLLKNFLLAFVPYTIVGVIVGLLMGVNILHVLAIIASMIVVNMTVNVLNEFSKPEKRSKIDHLKDVATAKK